MKKIFTLISVALVAMSVNAQEAETYVGATDAGVSAEFAAVSGGASGGVATNVSNGSSKVTFGT